MSRLSTAVSPMYLESLKTYERFAGGDSLFARAADRFHLLDAGSSQSIEALKRRVLKVNKVEGHEDPGNQRYAAGSKAGATCGAIYRRRNRKHEPQRKPGFRSRICGASRETSSGSAAPSGRGATAVEQAGGQPTHRVSAIRDRGQRRFARARCNSNSWRRRPRQPNTSSRPRRTGNSRGSNCRQHAHEQRS